ncbi:MAG: DUF465 domain-containing protein [Vitreoscilla sp.]|jgi:uncharacterized protein YdcH (DUF465 family)|nr:DUF465 domain-containing protein [Vitreoscilla sp.]
MFPEYRDLTLKLRDDDPEFSLMYQQHLQLDDQIKRLSNDAILAQSEDLESLKRQKLQLKDQMYRYLQDFTV